jgi:CHASE2 domain-containing sensor protein
MDTATLVHIFHILIIGSLFLYVGITKTNMPNFMYMVLLVTGIVIICYHGYRAYQKLMDGKFPWVNYIHMFLVGPVLVYIGLQKEKNQRMMFEIVLLLGFASIGYHGYYLVSPKADTANIVAKSKST